MIFTKMSLTKFQLGLTYEFPYGITTLNMYLTKIGFHYQQTDNRKFQVLSLEVQVSQ